LVRRLSHSRAIRPTLEICINIKRDRMTRIHFQNLADIVKLELDFLTEVERSQIALLLASFCNRHNTGFDEERFLTACEVDNLKKDS